MSATGSSNSSSASLVVKSPYSQGDYQCGDDVTPNSPLFLLFFIYSYAIIMWEVLSRQIPFEGEALLISNMWILGLMQYAATRLLMLGLRLGAQR